jgi:hypothetical protein
MITDNYKKNNRPFAEEMRVFVNTAGHESKKGKISDMWWGAGMVPRYGQPGFEGENVVVMQKGVLWLPCVEPFFW